MDLSFIASAVGSIAFAWAAIEIVPVVCKTILVSFDIVTVDEAKKLFERKKKGKF